MIKEKVEVVTMAERERFWLQLKERNNIKEKTSDLLEVKEKLERFKDGLLFFAHFLISPAKLGAPFPTCREIGYAITEELKKAAAEVVIELGAGLGNITSAMLEAISDSGKLLCVEKSPVFCKQLYDKFGKQITIVEGDALELNEIIRDSIWENPDAIVCSIPMANDQAYELSRMMAEILYPNGVLLQVTNYEDAIKEYFDVQKTMRFKLNFPPEKLHVAYPKK